MHREAELVERACTRNVKELKFLDSSLGCPVVTPLSRVRRTTKCNQREAPLRNRPGRNATRVQRTRQTYKPRSFQAVRPVCERVQAQRARQALQTRRECSAS